MKIFRQLRWKLTLSHTLVTVGAFLVITLVIGGILLIRIFEAESYQPPGYDPEGYIESFMDLENETRMSEPVIVTFSCTAPENQIRPFLITGLILGVGLLGAKEVGVNAILR